jgi:hypothetical protein
MVYVRDDGSYFEASIQTIWRYLNNGDQHGQNHKNSRNRQVKPVGEHTMDVSMERNWMGNWVKVGYRVTVLPPLGTVTEMLEGPFAGSKMFTVYSPDGLSRTRVDVFGEFLSPQLPPDQIEGAARRFLEESYNEDAPALKTMQASS